MVLLLIFFKKKYDYPYEALTQVKNIICETYPEYKTDIEKYMILI